MVSQNCAHTMSPKGTLSWGGRKKSAQVQNSKYQLKSLRVVDGLIEELTWDPGVQHTFVGNVDNWLSDFKVYSGLRGFVSCVDCHSLVLVLVRSERS